MNDCYHSEITLSDQAKIVALVNERQTRDRFWYSWMYPGFIALHVKHDYGE